MLISWYIVTLSKISMVYSNPYLDIRNSYYNKAAQNVNECDKGFLLILHIIARPVNDCLIDMQMPLQSRQSWRV